MVSIKELIILWLQFFYVNMIDVTHQKPATLLKWPGRCTKQTRVLNDCNWCRCDKKHEYVCEARTCTYVDKFGHFNDAIQSLDLGMEGHGVWRSTSLSCQPGVQYHRSGLLCVCTEDGTWPNPVCRDTFRVLHSVEQTGDTKVTGQSCSPTKLYMIRCNVCFCPSTGKLDPQLCTTKTCSDDDPVMKADGNEKDQVFKDEEIYAECETDQTYKLGCKTCNCLKNNRLVCGNCTFAKQSTVRSFCSRISTGSTFNIGCNLCFCDDKQYVYCSTKKCLLQHPRISPKNLRTAEIESELPFDEEHCIPGHSYKDGCNVCRCGVIARKKVFMCTKKQCIKPVTSQELIHKDCVAGTSYELNCLICQCDEVNGIKTQLCWENPECKSRYAVREARSHDLDSLHGYCEPLHEYKRDCNTCHCLSDGKTVKCTSRTCKDAQEPLTVDIIPISQNGPACPRGHSYKIECNYCFCLSNGNAICTTHDCRDANK